MNIAFRSKLSRRIIFHYFHAKTMKYTPFTQISSHVGRNFSLGNVFALIKYPTNPIDAVEDGIECDCDGEENDGEQCEDGERVENVLEM